MYERMLDKTITPTFEEMAAYCGEQKALFIELNDWLSKKEGSVQKIVFPYGNRYGWGVAWKIKTKLICNIFAENDAFTVMMRLSDKQYQSVYHDLKDYTQYYIDHRYPCGDGGWIHYRITCVDHIEDIKKLLDIKCLSRETKKI